MAISAPAGAICPREVITSETPALSLRDVRHAYASPAGPAWAVDGVSLVVGPQETLGLVGESGCGKSTLARLACGLLVPSEGQVQLMGLDVRDGSGAARRQRARAVQMVFQDPYASLNPRKRIGTQLAEPLQLHRLVASGAEPARVAELLSQVGLQRDMAARYPHELSGGQRQRVAIARALALEPRLLICDEPVSALDVSIQAQILNLLRDLKASLGLAFLFISHDLRVIRYMADRVAVMLQGRIVELGETDQIWENPAHDYTRRLLASLPPEI